MRVIQICAPTTVCNPKVCNPNVRVYFKVYYVALSTRSLTVNSQLISIQPVYAVSNRDSHDSRPYALSKRVSTQSAHSVARTRSARLLGPLCMRARCARDRTRKRARRRRGAAATRGGSDERGGDERGSGNERARPGGHEHGGREARRKRVAEDRVAEERGTEERRANERRRTDERGSDERRAGEGLERDAVEDKRTSWATSRARRASTCRGAARCPTRTLSPVSMITPTAASAMARFIGLGALDCASIANTRGQGTGDW